MRRTASVSILVLGAALSSAHAQSDSSAASEPNPPRPSAAPDPNAAGGSASADGYAPIPQWLGQTRAPLPAHRERYEVETVVSGIEGGFSFAFLPDGSIVLTERRTGHMRIARDGEIGEPIAGLPEIWTQGPQGLLHVRPDRDFSSNRIIYFSYTAPPHGPLADPPPRLAGIQYVARARLSDDMKRLEDVEVLLDTEGIEGRFVQAADGSLFVTSGIPAGVGINSSDWPQPQRLDSRMGKVLHIDSDGTVPSDNPFVDASGAYPEIYAYGLREDQGIAIDPLTGGLWASENGPRGGDEINRIEKGKNYGFPIISYGHEYTGAAINDGLTAKAGMEQPVYFWTPSIAPSGIEFYTGDLFPAWKGDLFVAAMAGKHVVRLVLDGSRQRVAAEERLLTELDTRFRDVHTGPDGALYVLTDAPRDARILRLVPEKGR